MRRTLWLAGIVLFVFCLLPIAQIGAQPEDKLAAFTALEPIDTHAHVFQTGADFIAMLQRLHMHLLDVMVVDDTNPYRKLESERPDALQFVAASMGHAHLCTTFDAYQFNKPDFAKEAIAGLNADFDRGAIAVKIWKNAGMEIKNAAGKYILPDDPKLAPIYKDIAAHHKPLLAHLAEPDAAWGSAVPNAPYGRYYQQNPEWDMSKKPDAPSKQTILDARDHVLKMNPNLHMVGAHLGSMEGNLDQVAERLKQYPNFAVDVAARVQSFMILPREKVRDFIIQNQDRILYGTDLGFYPGRADATAAKEWENRYTNDWRYFGTDETFQYQGRQVQGLGLPRPVLKKLYHDNAVHWIPGIVDKAR